MKGRVGANALKCQELPPFGDETIPVAREIIEKALHSSSLWRVSCYPIVLQKSKYLKRAFYSYTVYILKKPFFAHLGNE